MKFIYKFFKKFIPVLIVAIVLVSATILHLNKNSSTLPELFSTYISFAAAKPQVTSSDTSDTNTVVVKNTTTDTTSIISNSTSKKTIKIGATVPTVEQRYKAVSSELNNLGQQYDIQILLTPTRKILPYGSWNIVAQVDVNELEAMTRYIKDEWVKYPKSFVKATGLKYIFLVKDLKVENQYRSAMPDPEYDNALYYDISAKYVYADSGRYIKNVIHHEFGHMVEHNINGSYAWNDSTYKQCNIANFGYGNGGASAYSNSEFANTKHATNGFVSGYGTYGLEEDKAEVFAELMTDYDGFKQLASTDPNLQCKFELYQKYLSQMDNSMTPQYLDSKS